MTVDKNKSPSNFVPNSFQIPNIYIDHVIPYLTSEEWRVLSFAIRHILGWQDKIADRQAYISLSRFSKCGLNTNTVSKALLGLQLFNLLVPVGGRNQKGQLYKLIFDDEKIDWDAMEIRTSEKKEHNKNRIQKARKSRGVLSDKRPEQEVECLVRQETSVLSDKRPGVLSDKKNQIQPLKTNKKTIKKNSSSNKLYEQFIDEWVSLFPGKPKPRLETKSYKTKFTTRFKDACFRENWLLALQRAATSPTLQKEAWFNVTFFLKDDINYQKCLDGWMDWKDEQNNGGDDVTQALINDGYTIIGVND